MDTTATATATATATISLLLRHPYSLPPPPPPPWPSFHLLRNRPFLHPLATSHTPLCHFRFRLFAIRSRNFDLSGLNFDDDKGKNGGGDFDRNKRRKRRTGKRSKKRRWWSVQVEEEEDSVARESKSGTLKQVMDSIWIFKVLTSYGWFLPFIMLSLLLATGPKAFLMAFSIPLGLSLVILAFQKLCGWLDDSPKLRRKLKTRSPFSTRNDLSMEEDDIEEEIQPKRINQRRDYRSWVISSDNSRASVSSFGGWDELVTEKETRRARRGSEMGKPKLPVEEEKFSRSLEERDLPLLLRLLVALFPFLGSWTDLL